METGGREIVLQDLPLFPTVDSWAQLHGLLSSSFHSHMGTVQSRLELHQSSISTLILILIANRNSANIDPINMIRLSYLSPSFPAHRIPILTRFWPHPLHYIKHMVDHPHTVLQDHHTARLGAQRFRDASQLGICRERGAGTG
jgi:hypothetical protein